MTIQQGSSFSKGMKRTALSVTLGMCVAGGVQAQSISGTVRGTAPVGTKVIISNNSGFSRTINTDASGRYSVSSLPVGDYTVDAAGLGKRAVTVTTGATVDVSFSDSSATDLSTVTVHGVSAPSIDITSVSTTTVVTAEQLKRLPLVQNAQAIALLSPGANAGAGGYFGDLTSFGGSGVSENAYYINGYFSGDPLSNLRAFELPYIAIAQQETYTGGYSAKYGRSDGGVISQVGKSGTNDVHFGGQVTYAPKGLRANGRDTYFPNVSLTNANSNPNLPINPSTGTPYQYEYEDASLAGKLYRARAKDQNSNERYSGYVSGPLIKDHLFGFVAAEAYEESSYRVPATPDYGITQRSTHSKTSDPKIYVKLDWNINDKNLFSYTYLSEKYDSEGNYSNYDFDTQSDGTKLTVVPTPTSRNSEYSILNYTGYLTDSLTLNATYGHMRLATKQINPSILTGVPYVVATNQNPAYGTATATTSGGYQSKDATDETNGLRADLEWVVGNHTLTAGIDNIKFEANNEGTAQVADYWAYGRTTSNINAAKSVGSPVTATNPRGYYARQLKYFNNTDMSLTQDAWYLEDRWQLTSDVLVSIGIRNDKFNNKNGVGESYLDAKNQWAPRLGAAWDVFGDSSFKVFGNAGRYFLALPNNVAIRGASASTFTNQYYTYTGIDQYGAPTGVTPVPSTDGTTPSGPVSSNLEYGYPVDVESFAPKDLKNLYQDEYILGFEKRLGEAWSFGAKFTYRDLKSSVDDLCDPASLASAAGLTLGDEDPKVGKLVATAADGQQYNISGCYMFNPGGSNTYSFENRNPNGARLEKKISATELGFQDGLKRTYKAVDLFLEHPFDGKWEARLDYTYSKLEGNNEGQVKSEFGQSNISKTQDWDAWQIMQYADGYLANDRRHQIKAHGSYAITDEWLVSGNVRILSGTPISCLGYFNPNGSIDEGSVAADPIGYGSSYHTCLGQIAKPGKVRTSWQHTVDLGVAYRPNYFDGRLTLGVQVMNALNSQKATQVDVTSEVAAYQVSQTYLQPIAYETPRYLLLNLALDF